MEKHNYCSKHKDRPATGYCAYCGSAFCEECHQGPYCKFCIEVPLKKKSIALLLVFLLGWLGGHRYYMGFYFTGVIYTLTFGLFGIGWAVDFIRILFFSTPKIETIRAMEKYANYNVSHGSTVSFLERAIKYRHWLDKYHRPLLQFGQ